MHHKILSASMDKLGTGKLPMVLENQKLQGGFILQRIPNDSACQLITQKLKRTRLTISNSGRCNDDTSIQQLIMAVKEVWQSPYGYACLSHFIMSSSFAAAA